MVDIMPKRAEFCPKNGCGMPNGAASPVPVICKNCGYGSYNKPYSLTNFNKFCPICFNCISCGRIIKKKAKNEGKT